MVRHRQPVDTQRREKQRDDMQCECLREKKKRALKHSIIYVPAASLSPQPLLLERESIRKAANGKRGLQSAEAQHCSFSWEERGREPLAFSSSIRVCARVRLVDTAAVLALAGDLHSIFQNAQQSHWMRRGRWGTQQSGWVVWSCNWVRVCADDEQMCLFTGHWLSYQFKL